MTTVEAVHLDNDNEPSAPDLDGVEIMNSPAQKQSVSREELSSHFSRLQRFESKDEDGVYIEDSHRRLKIVIVGGGAVAVAAAVALLYGVHHHKKDH